MWRKLFNNKVFNDKPIISNQHGALVMAFIPFLYGIFASQFSPFHLLFAASWLFLYFCSYPFLALFNRKNRQKQQKWALIYAIISALFALPLLWHHPELLQFALWILPLAAVQIFYAKRKDERNLINDIAGILTFGIVGMASYFLTTGEYNGWILLHPTLFFIATTLYIKSVARERKNPHYLTASLASHIALGIGYLACQHYAIAVAYLAATLRAALVPKKSLNIKQVGILEFAISALFLAALALT